MLHFCHYLMDPSLLQIVTVPSEISLNCANKHSWGTGPVLQAPAGSQKLDGPNHYKHGYISARVFWLLVQLRNQISPIVWYAACLATVRNIYCSFMIMSLFVMLDVLCSDVAGWAPSARLYANLEWVFILKIFLQIGNSWKKIQKTPQTSYRLLLKLKVLSSITATLEWDWHFCKIFGLCNVAFSDKPSVESSLQIILEVFNVKPIFSFPWRILSSYLSKPELVSVIISRRDIVLLKCMVRCCLTQTTILLLKSYLLEKEAPCLLL